MKKLIIAATFLFATSSYGQTMIEPYAGYGMGNYSIANNGGTGKSSGTVLGARLGYSFPLIFVAFDGSMAKGKNKSSDNTVNDNFSSTVLGAAVGINSTMGFRAWVGYNFSDSFKDTTQNPTFTYKGTSYKVGVGYKLPLAPVSFNGEYLMSTYTKGNGTTLTNNLSVKTFIVSVSFPFMLM